MKKIESIVWLIAILGIFLKFFHLPGSVILITLALSILATFYYLFSFALFNDIKLRDIAIKESYRNINAKRIIVAVGLGIAIALIITGSLFNLLHFPGKSVMLLTGLIAMIIIYVVAINSYFRDKNDFYKRIFKRPVIYTVLLLMLISYIL